MKTPDVIDPTIPQIARQRDELAAIAERLEKQRDELAAALRVICQFVYAVDCESLDHPGESFYHLATEVCPIAEKVNSALEAGRAALAGLEGQA